MNISALKILIIAAAFTLAGCSATLPVESNHVTTDSANYDHHRR
ncbi:MAG: hypothetical protein ACRBHB_12785 [Arenicella sp.]